MVTDKKKGFDMVTRIQFFQIPIYAHSKASPALPLYLILTLVLLGPYIYGFNNILYQ